MDFGNNFLLKIKLRLHEHEIIIDILEFFIQLKIGFADKKYFHMTESKCSFALFAGI